MARKKGENGMDRKVTQEVWTPAMARMAIAATSGQRPLSQNHVAMIRRDMATPGRWNPSPLMPVGLGARDNIINGNHRMHALAGLPDGAQVILWVLRDTTMTEAMSYHIDVGIRPRRPAASLGLRKHLVEEARALLVFAVTESPSAAEIRDCALSIQIYSDDLTSTSRGRVTVAGVRAACVTQRILGTVGHCDWCGAQYFAMANQAYTDMAPAVQSLNRQLLSRRVRNQNEALALALRAFAPGKASVKLLRAGQNDMAALRELVRDALAQVGVKI